MGRGGASLPIGLGLGLLGLAPASEGRPAGTAPTIGYLLPGPPRCPPTPSEEAFDRGLRDLGYLPGQSIVVDRRCFRTGDEMRNTTASSISRQPRRLA